VDEAVKVNVGEAALVALAVPVEVLVAVAVLVKVAVLVNVGDGVKVLVGGTNWVGVLGKVTVGPPGVTVGSVAVGVTEAASVVAAATVVNTNWVGVSGKGVALAVVPLFGYTRTKNPAQ
jgi:hypothetical protein